MWANPTKKVPARTNCSSIRSGTGAAEEALGAGATESFPEASLFQQGMASHQPSRPPADKGPTLICTQSNLSSILQLQHSMLAASAAAVCGPSPLQKPSAVIQRSHSASTAGTSTSKALNLKRRPAAHLLFRAQHPKRHATAGPAAAGSSSVVSASHSPTKHQLPSTWPLQTRAHTGLTHWGPVVASQQPLPAQPKLQRVDSTALPLVARLAVSAQQQAVPHDVEATSAAQHLQAETELPSGADCGGVCFEATLKRIEGAHQQAQAALHAASSMGLIQNMEAEPVQQAAGGPLLSAVGTEQMSPTLSTVTATPIGSQSDPLPCFDTAWAAISRNAARQPSPRQLLALLRAATEVNEADAAAAAAANACRLHMTNAVGAGSASELRTEPTAVLLLGRMSAAYSQLAACTQELVRMLTSCRQLAGSQLQGQQRQQYIQQQQHSQGGCDAELTAAAVAAAAAATPSRSDDAQRAPLRGSPTQPYNNSTLAGCVMVPVPGSPESESHAALVCLQQQLAATQQQHQEQRTKAAATLASSAHQVLAVTESAEGLSPEERMRLLNVVTELLMLMTQQKP